MLDKKYNAEEKEKKWLDYWKNNKIYQYKRNGKEVYSIDTPPPTVNGKIHVGHIFSYTQTEMLARYKRLRGYNIFYPFGFDDNGLPSERLVEKEQGKRAHEIGREEFSKLCYETTDKYEENFQELFSKMGVSTDWDIHYKTVSPSTIKISQTSFLELKDKGHCYHKESPALWCNECLTSIAQAELETKTINNHSDVEFMYSDEDKIETTEDTRRDPHFKPDFAIDTLRSNNYITHLSVFKKELMDKIGGFRSEYDGAQDYDVIIRACELTNNIIHIPKILYHWRVHPNSTAMISDAKPYAYKAGLRVIEDHLKRQGLDAKVTFGGDIPGVYEVEYKVIGNPKVSIIIPNKDNIRLLKSCINSILRLTTYNNYEIVVVENNSTDPKTFDYYDVIQKLDKVRVIKYPEKGFNYSKIINFGVKNCEDSDFVVQLNSDTELITPNWLEKFIGFAQRKDVGAVGARLYYGDKSIQHAGVGIAICDLAANLLTNTPNGFHAYYGRECLTQDLSAVTGACLFSKQSIYKEVGYMDENNFAVAFNDVDFCLKIRQKGYLIVYDPYVELMHYESKTRGYENTPEKKERFERESNNFRTKWRKILDAGDPYSNINFDKNTAQYNVRTDKIAYKE